MLEHLTRKLGRIISRDFPSVKKLVFLKNPLFEVVDAEAFYTFADTGICLPGCLYWTSGLSQMSEGLAAVIVPLCGSLTGLVDTTLHEAAHIQYKSVSCELPNRVSENNMQSYLTMLFS